jgi:UDP-N-acetylmuramoyl-tripeptide--D-alanyl-D-alanine ligase
MLTLGDASGFCSSAELHGPHELRFTGVSTDTRTIAPGDLYVALRGERFDGHAFVSAAQQAGAVAALLEHPVGTSLPSIVVPDTRLALGELAMGWRQRFDVPVIVVVGSNGKTTTKEMIASILAAEFGEARRLATRGSLNNEIGLPLTLLSLRTAHQAVVLELGMNHPGETRWLAQVAQPTITLVTNAQREHQEFMKTVTAVAGEHALAIEALKSDGIAVFPGRDPMAAIWYAAAGARRIVDFTLEKMAEPPCSVTAVVHLELFNTVVHLDTSEGAVSARLATAGLHNAHNATAAAAAALAAGARLESIQRGLEQFAPVKGRLVPGHTALGALVIDDTYNANPDSMRAAIEVLAACPKPQLLILGDMGESGTSAHAFHLEIGRFAKDSGIGELYATGVQMEAATGAFGAGAVHFESVAQLTEAARAWLLAPGREKPSVLVKGSRFMAMESVVKALLESDGTTTPAGTL